MSGPQTIHGPYGALMALMIDWPEPSQKSDDAMSACDAAIDGSGSVEQAYSAFVAAVEYEKLRLHGSQKSSKDNMLYATS